MFFLHFFISMHDPDTPGSMLWLKYPWHEPKMQSAAMHYYVPECAFISKG